MQKWQRLVYRTFQSTPLLREATSCGWLLNRGCCISIHAPLTRGDLSHLKTLLQLSYFNPRPSYERRPMKWIIQTMHPGFQSTPLLREATLPLGAFAGFSAFQSTPLLREATISFIYMYRLMVFQSTPLLREATENYWR